MNLEDSHKTWIKLLKVQVARVIKLLVEETIGDLKEAEKRNLAALAGT